VFLFSCFSGDWKKAKFKPLNLVARGKEIGGGHLHPLLKVRTEFRSMLLEMGFEEMPTAKWVESSFWNFDSLFQPQSHPARDAHDTFFLTGWFGAALFFFFVFLPCGPVVSSHTPRHSAS